MPVFTVTDPSGKEYDVTVPVGATNEDAIDYLIELQGGTSNAPSNNSSLLDSVGNFMGGSLQGTANAVGDVMGFGAGAAVWLPTLIAGLMDKGISQEQAMEIASKMFHKFATGVQPPQIFGNEEMQRQAEDTRKAWALPATAGGAVGRDVFQHIEQGADPEKVGAAGEMLGSLAGGVAAGKVGAKVAKADMALMDRFAKPNELPKFEETPTVPKRPAEKPPVQLDLFRREETVPTQLELFDERMAPRPKPEVFEPDMPTAREAMLKRKVEGINPLASFELRLAQTLGREDHPIMMEWRKADVTEQVLKSEFEPLVNEFSEIHRKARSKLGKKAQVDLDILASNDFVGWGKAVDKILGNTKGSEIRAKLADAFEQRWERIKRVHPEAQKIESPNGYFPQNVANVETLLKLEKSRRNSTLISKMEKASADFKNGLIDNAEYQSQIRKALTEGGRQDVVPAKAQHAKKRVMPRITRRVAPAYSAPDTALRAYFDDTGRAIAQREFLGKGDIPIEDSIQAKVAKAVTDKQLTTGQAEVIRELLRKRYSPEVRRAMNPGLQTLVSGTHLGTIANPVSGSVNVLDVLPSAANLGVVNTIGAAAKSAMPRALRKRMGVIEPTEQGLHQVSHEAPKGVGLNPRRIMQQLKEEAKSANGPVEKIASYTKTVVHEAFRYFFSPFDRFGKRTILNAALSKASKAAKGNDAWLQKNGYHRWYKSEAEWNSFKDALKRRDIKDVRVREVVLNELFKIQPQTITSMPINYAMSPNGRILYTLKSWSIRQLNMQRTSLAQRNYKQLAKQMAAVAASGAATTPLRDAIMSAITGREMKDLDDYAVIALFNYVLASKFAFEKGGIGDVVKDFAMPTPLGFWADVLNDAQKAIVDGEVPPRLGGRIPAVGPFVREALK